MSKYKNHLKTRNFGTTVREPDVGLLAVSPTLSNRILEVIIELGNMSQNRDKVHDDLRPPL